MIRIMMTLNLILMNINVFASVPGESPSGAIAVVCRGSEGKIRNAQLLDLYEATDQYDRKLWPSLGSIEDDYLSAAKNFHRLQGSSDWDKSDEASAKTEVKRFIDSAKYTAPGEDLRWIGDLEISIQPPPECKFEQLAIFNEKNDILIDSTIWNFLPSQSKAALLTHQVSFRDALQFEDRPSPAIRKTVGLIYSLNGIPVFEGLPSKRMACFANSFLSGGFTNFFVFPMFSSDGKKLGSILQFQQLAQRSLVAKTTARLDGIYWNLLIKDPSTGYDIQYPRVQELGAHKKIRSVLESEQFENSELEVTYYYDQPVQITLIQNGVPRVTETVEFCLNEEMN